jgi:hypothetical protein
MRIGGSDYEAKRLVAFDPESKPFLPVAFSRGACENRVDEEIGRGYTVERAYSL